MNQKQQAEAHDDGIEETSESTFFPLRILLLLMPTIGSWTWLSTKPQQTNL